MVEFVYIFLGFLNYLYWFNFYILVLKLGRVGRRFREDGFRREVIMSSCNSIF